MDARIKKFSGEGTVLSCDILSSRIDPGIPPMEWLGRLEASTEIDVRIIEGNSGVVVRRLPADMLGFWGPSGAHAQMAFDTACEILKAQSPRTIPLWIALGTGELGGDFFGPQKQFQIVGKAMAIVDRLFKNRGDVGAVIRMSQDTASLIKAPAQLRETGIIERRDLEPLKVYEYCPAN
ncbi:MAG: hypothetical protein HY077_15520 [Elusimicrobia bacterium]|nr:hypothetical protein [Elusimicrobiota bacterium]